METEDSNDLPPACNSVCKGENDDLHNSNCMPSDAGSQPSNSEITEGKLNGETSGTLEVDVGDGGSQPVVAADLSGSSSVLEVSVELNETVVVAEDVKFVSTEIQTENGLVTVQDGSPISNRKRGGSPISNREIDDTYITGVKKARTTVDEQQSSVHIKYHYLRRDSKRKLEELLQKWSDWHAQHCSSLDSGEVLESGEETYFPAIRVGLDNPSSVSFWMDNQTRDQRSAEFIALDNKTVPLYDRGYSLEGGLEIGDASRCFNCSSYGHSLKECPKPRDAKAVNNARKEHNSKRNQNAHSRNPTRYYQDSPRGKYDGLRPGVLDAETRKLLGLGELDPPPWLNRMREMGYPPGYLDAELEDQPSGITIFDDEEIKEEKEKEDGEILEAGNPPDPPKKMSVGFPGINAPIPENADEKRWTSGSSSSNSSRNRSHHRNNHSSETMNRGQYHDRRWDRDFKDDGPPGCDPVFSTSYPPRYGGYDSPQYSGGNVSIPSPSFGRSMSDRGRWNPSVLEGSSNPGSHSSVPYSSPNAMFSPPSYGSAGFPRRADDSRNGFDSDLSSHRRDSYHHRSRR